MLPSHRVQLIAIIPYGEMVSMFLVEHSEGIPFPIMYNEKKGSRLLECLRVGEFFRFSFKVSRLSQPLLLKPSHVPKIKHSVLCHAARADSRDGDWMKAGI